MTRLLIYPNQVQSSTLSDIVEVLALDPKIDICGGTSSAPTQITRLGSFIPFRYRRRSTVIHRHVEQQIEISIFLKCIIHVSA